MGIDLLVITFKLEKRFRLPIQSLFHRGAPITAGDFHRALVNALKLSSAQNGTDLPTDIEDVAWIAVKEVLVEELRIDNPELMTKQSNLVKDLGAS